jgi:hypothetical protein
MVAHKANALCFKNAYNKDKQKHVYIYTSGTCAQAHTTRILRRRRRSRRR